ncbi:MAG: sigma-70 family RNA polymerase sigma factor [Leptolyngbyaceae cyanobacterium RM2_2_4]|nr:sigma-70 family RNA polymerase sigma factor [Leptolyngbyaceae cyanobacterium SM1_4_3]NJN90532.1 sigma-70 family RNA polymerase sigma factor [Leptolyngbyaceae cyanobacterium SL_5_14]NJO50506.1 sigma-70 family RNA polymerase sigma factor [Leptolyngbyaceae cyanobacterium RM2_2_4]
MSIQPSSEEAELLIRIAQKDQVALSRLYDRYARVIYGVAFKILGSAEETEEVVLDVFSQVWRTAHRYNPAQGRVDAWLFMITRSRSLDRLRVIQRLAKAVAASTDAIQAHSLSSSITPGEDLLIRERRDRILAALAQLSEDQRKVLELAYYKGLTHVEIAAQTGASLGTVKTRIRLGLSKLRKRLDLV